MSPVPALVLSAPGTNRDGESAFALELAGAAPQIVPITALADDPGLLDRFRMMVIAGGFSYADALGSGRVFALELDAVLGDRLPAFVDAGRPVLGICNGFQVLVRTGLLPGLVGGGRGLAQLAPNAHGRFECRWVTMAPVASRSVWTEGLPEPILTPIAHGEGRFVCDEATHAALVGEGRVALRYALPDGTRAEGRFPHNPNGSTDDIAGICDHTGLVLGLMPHPEDHVVARQHPGRARGEQHGSGLPLFRNGVRRAMEAS